MTRTTVPWYVALSVLVLAGLVPLPALAQVQPPPVPPEQQVVPPPVPPEVVVEYFVVEAGAAAGPFNMAQLQGRVAAGTLRPTTKVWAEGMADWVEASTVAALAPLFAAAPPKPPEPTVDYSAFIVGAWETTGPVKMGDANGFDRSVLTFNADRSFELFSQGSFTHFQGPFETRITGQGTYTVHTVSSGKFELRLTGTQTLEILNFSSGGQVSTYSPVIQVTIIDQNTIESGTGRVSRRLGF